MATRSKSPQGRPPEPAELVEQLARQAAATLIPRGGISMLGKLIIVVALAVASYLIPETRVFSGWILFFGVIVAFVIEGVRIVPQQHAVVVERLGKFHEVLQPGLNLIIPFLDRIAY